MKSAAIYARVSSDKQREENTIASQTAALVAFAREQQFEVPREWVFEDDGSVRISFYPQDRSLGRVLPDQRRAGSRCTVDV
jgi:hypothetical protein